MYEYMAAAAVAQSFPLVFKCDPDSKEVTQDKFRSPDETGPDAGKEKWESVIYREYLNSKKNLNTNRKFKVINPFNFVYNWKQILKRNGTLDGYETVKIVLEQTEVPAEHGGVRQYIPVIIFHPSWKYPTLYIVDDPRILSLDVTTQKGLIRNTAIWWNGIGIHVFRQDEIGYDKRNPGVSRSGGLRRRSHRRKKSRSRKTRRTRRK